MFEDQAWPQIGMDVVQAVFDVGLDLADGI
jgi:hypothetical protein